MTSSQVSRTTGISRFSVRAWTVDVTPSPPMTAECPVRNGGLEAGRPRADYAYLLGLYLGDGCISGGRRQVRALRIACGDAWPGLIASCAQAVSAVMPQNKAQRVRTPGCTGVVSTGKHWPCLFPQDGPGPEHLRRITLSPWQQRISTRIRGTCSGA